MQLQRIMGQLKSLLNREFIGFTVFLLLFFTFSSISLARTTLKLTTADNQNSSRSKVMNAVLIECFNRMGMGLEIIHLPSKRSLINANLGIEDGNFVRTDGISATYPHLVKVPENISVNRIMAFSKNSAIKVNGWKSLLKYQIAYINGWKNCERELQQSKRKIAVKNEELLFTLIEKNRADVAIFGESTGVEVIRELGYSDIKALEPPIVVSALFLYIHKKHEELIPEIVQTLRGMKEDGTFTQLLQQFHQ